MKCYPDVNVKRKMATSVKLLFCNAEKTVKLKLRDVHKSVTTEFLLWKRNRQNQDHVSTPSCKHVRDKYVSRRLTAHEMSNKPHLAWWFLPWITKM